MCRRRRSIRTVRSACSAPRSKPTLPRPHHHRPHPVGLDQAEPDAVKALRRDGKVLENGRITKHSGLPRPRAQPIDSAEAGDIVAIAGLKNAPSPTPSAIDP
jgi:translation elongation factor EF-G